MESLLRVMDLDNTVILMLPLGFSVGVILNLIIHWVAFERDFSGFTKSLMRPVYEVFAASIIMGSAAHAVLGIIGFYTTPNTLLTVFLDGFVAGIVGIAIGVFVLYLLKSKELVVVFTTLKHKIWKAKVVPADTTGAVQ
jgi:uncharacterized membrane protein